MYQKLRPKMKPDTMFLQEEPGVCNFLGILRNATFETGWNQKSENYFYQLSDLTTCPCFT